MIYAYARRLKALLGQKDWNVPVVYGPEAFERLPNCTEIVIFRDGSADAFVSNRTHSGGRSSAYVAARDISAIMRVHAQSTAPSATRWDHENLADAIVDAIFCASIRWANELAAGAPRNAPITFGAGRIVPRSELPGIYDKFTGVIYDQPITLQRAVQDLTPAGVGYTTALIPAVDTTLTDTLDPSPKRVHVIAPLPG